MATTTRPVRAKMECTVSKEEFGQHRVELQAVYNDGEENKAFFAATPAGSVVLYLVRPEVGQRFVPGTEYYVDFIPAS